MEFATGLLASNRHLRDVLTSRGSVLGYELDLKREVLSPLRKEQLPPVAVHRDDWPFRHTFPSEPLNHDYFKELHFYLIVQRACGRYGFVLSNDSGVVAHDVRAELTIPVTDELIVLDEFPSVPLARSISHR